MIKKIFSAIIIGSIILILGVPWLISRFNPVQGAPQETEVSLYLHQEDKVVSMPLEEYLIGVVAAEMPASFPPEALKAQAVAARTYVLKRMGSVEYVNPVHSQAVACDEPRHFQAWIPKEEMKKRWGALGYYENYYRISKAVQDTKGEVIVCEGQLIDPVYHSSCGGIGTENAADVWRFEIPYLQAVSCPYDADPEPERTVVLSREKVLSALQLQQESLPVTAGGGGLPAFEIVEKTATGRPKTIRINDENISAATLRDYLGLRSTNFQLTPCPEGLEVKTLGYGHAVGMCQYGAKGFALQGKNYQQILQHYYTGVSILKY